MALTAPDRRAQYDVRRPERAFEARPELRMGATQQAHALRQQRPAATVHDFHPRSGPGPGARAAIAQRAAEARRPRVAMVPQNRPNGGDHGGGHPDPGGGGHGGPRPPQPHQQQADHGHGHGH